LALALCSSVGAGQGACSRQPPALEPAPASPAPASPAPARFVPPAPAAAEPGEPALPRVSGFDLELALALADGLLAACPAVAESDTPSAARQRCADGLTALAVLRDASRDPVLWGARRPGAGNDIHASRTTQMNARVLRRMYLSTFVFEGEYRVEPTALGLVLHVPCHFRLALDPGDYPYPFWHSADKWRSYESSRELLFFIERGEVRAVLRSDERDEARPHVEHAWDGHWRWQSERGAEPRDALYASLFSPANPHAVELDAAYRAFEQAQRAHACVSCHDPSNRAQQNPLELFSYPNQALTGRHDIVRELALNAMPPATAGAPAGIADQAERQRLLGLARRFAELGDRALAFEGEPVPPSPASP
jgi:hypothetical protein